MRRSARSWVWLSCWLAMGAMASTGTVAAATVASALADLTLEQLGEIRVTAVSGRPERVQDAPAAVYVITAQDIRRSAATRLPEVLRLAPNLQVAQVSADLWAISARGSNTAIANKLLVLLDGRTIYSTLFAGVIWDMHDVMLEDIERIEVVSGPGGALWGANAVNGVINIVTRSAAQTQGPLASVTRSTRGGREAARWGTRLGDNIEVRAWGIATDIGNTTFLDGTPRQDDRSRHQFGLRADWRAGSDQFTFIGDLHRAGDHAATRDSPNHHGGSLLARWSGQLPGGSPFTLQAYHWLADRDELTTLRNRSRVSDIEFRHEPDTPSGQRLLWGAGWRQANDTNAPSALIGLQPAERTLSWASTFVQHQALLAPAWTLTTGLKAERNSYTGWELMPNLRLAWQHSERNTTWAAISRAVRAPSRVDRELFIPPQAPFLVAGGPDFQSETAVSYELGHHSRIGERLSWSGTLFAHRLEGLRAGVEGQVPATVQNLVEGRSVGVETWARWQVTRSWRLDAGALLQRTRRQSVVAGDLRTVFPDLGNDPSAQWSLRSRHDLARGIELDLALRRVGRLRTVPVPAYTALDMRLGWRVSPSLTLAVLGQNLLDPRHQEFAFAPAASQIDRRVFIQAVWAP